MAYCPASARARRGDGGELRSSTRFGARELVHAVLPKKNAKGTPLMSFREKLKREVKSVLGATLFFAGWFLLMVVLKTLILAEYHVEFSGLLKAIVGALVIAKVVIVLERVRFGSWVRSQPAWVDVVLRTLLYMAGTFLVLLGERTFEGRHEYGGFRASAIGAFESANAAHVLAKTIAVGWGLLVFNALAVVRRRLGSAALLDLFASPFPAEAESPR